MHGLLREVMMGVNCVAGHSPDGGNLRLVGKGTKHPRWVCLKCEAKAAEVGADRARSAVREAAGVHRTFTEPLGDAILDGVCLLGHVLGVRGVWAGGRGDFFCRACMDADTREASRLHAAAGRASAGDSYPLEHLRLPFHSNMTVEDEWAAGNDKLAYF